MLTTYQSIIKNHLEAMFRLNPMVSDTVVFMVCEKELVKQISKDNDYVPAFGAMVSGEYMTVNFIQIQPQC